MSDKLLIDDDGEGWPFVRAAKFCPICQASKVARKIVCNTCRTTRTFLSMTRSLTSAEQGMRWNAERKPDAQLPPRAGDPTLAPCECGSADLVFMNCETPGKIVGNRIMPKTRYYARCQSCNRQTIPRTSKKLAAQMWVAGGKGVFIP